MKLGLGRSGGVKAFCEDWVLCGLGKFGVRAFGGRFELPMLKGGLRFGGLGNSHLKGCFFAQQQQQLPNRSCLYGVWEDPNVPELTSMRKKHIKISFPRDPQKTVFEK